MAGTSDIKRKIASVKNTQKITKAMKMVSAAKMRRAQDAMVATRPFAHKITEMVHDVARRANPELHPFLAGNENKETIGLIVVTSDRGLCGAFNNNVIKSMTRFAEENKGKKLKLVCVGKKAFEFSRRRELEILEKYVDFAGKVLFSDAVNISDVVVGQFHENGIGDVYVLYNEFKSTSSQIPVIEKLLPLSIENTGEQLIEYIYEPEPEMLLSELMPRYVRYKIFQALLESTAGEHGSRMMAMDNASRNASDMIGKLTLTYNKARQAAITNEILDIVNGAEALNG